MLLDLHTGFSGGRSSGLLFPSLFHRIILLAPPNKWREWPWLRGHGRNLLGLRHCWPRGVAGFCERDPNCLWAVRGTCSLFASASASCLHRHHSGCSVLPQNPPISEIIFVLFCLAYPSEGRQNENHSHRKLTKLITWITALSNLMKLWAVLCRATQDGQAMVERSDRMWSTGEGNSKPLQYSALRTPWTDWR